MSRSRAKNTTFTQDNYRNSILKVKPKKQKVKEAKPLEVPNKPIATIDDLIKNKVYYLNNCMFCINEYQAGRTDRDRFISALRSMAVQANEVLGAMLNFKK